MKFLQITLFTAILNMLLVSSAVACDLCAIYTSIGSETPDSGKLRLGTAYRFVEYRGTASDLAAFGANFNQEQEMESSFNQFFGNYQLNQNFGVQANLPYIYRNYKRLENGQLRSGKEYGLGDISILGRINLINYKADDRFLIWDAYGGLKLPTGDDDRLAEEQDEAPAGGRLTQLSHGAPNGNLVDGADLALGSGSYDFPLGTTLLVQKSRYFLRANVQGIFRTEGAYDYQYGNSIYFDAGPGIFLFTEHELTASLWSKLGGDFKDQDRINGSSIQGSDENFLFLGPEFNLSAGANLKFSLGVDFVLEHDSEQNGVQPQYRITSGFSVKL